MRLYVWLLALIVLASCKKLFIVTMPDLHWADFDAPANKPLNNDIREKIEGVYQVLHQEDDFGDEVALKWSWTANGKDTLYHLSMFCKEDVRYLIVEGKRKDSSIILNGYWRNVENTKIGKVHLLITPDKGGMQLLGDSGLHIAGSVVISGMLGMYDDEPDKKIEFKYLRPLYRGNPLEIVAHRGGGRNSDLLPATENSLEMIKLASRFGATGIEIDVKLSKDGMPVLYHDANVNDRLTNKTGVHAPIEDYTYAEIQKELRLIDGQKIPTLREALQTVLECTPLKYVWLDTKSKNEVAKLKALQQEFMEKAAAMGKPLEITIGVPDEDVYNELMAIPGHEKIPTVCELDTTKANALNSRIWAQGWVKGVQNEEVKAMQQKGRRAFVWTIDAPRVMRKFLKEGHFNGFLTNRASQVAYYYYAKQY